MRPRFAPVKYDVVTLRGGWDQVTPSLSLAPGVIRDALNFECAPTGGYTRIGGYERFDGQPRPSDAIYEVLQVVTLTNTPASGDIITGGTSGATGVTIATGANYVVVTKVTGAFVNAEALTVGATPIGTTEALSASITAKQYAQFLAAAADEYRADITAVPGSGSVRGVFGLEIGGLDFVFAFRDNVGATSCDLYVASGASWVQVPYLREVYFTTGAGGVTPVAGETLTQGANTAVVRRVLETSGSTNWAGTTAGKLIIEAPAPGPLAAGAATLSGGATLVLTGADTAITMLPGGKFEFDEGNFTGFSGTLKAYGCDGVNRCFEFDGEVLAPIDTGLTTDTPKHIVVHKEHLMVSYLSSLIHSGPGTPSRFLSADGGGEIAVSDNITGLLTQPGDQTTAALTIYGRTTISVLYGTGNSDWNRVRFNNGAGALDYTAQNLAQSYALDTSGVMSLAATLAYGNFQSAALTNNILPFIQQHRSLASCATVNRSRSQYRLFFSDGYGLYLTIVNGKMLGAAPVLFPTAVNCVWEGRSGGDSVTYIGDADGYVHELDAGSSFDGASIEAYFTLNWNAVGSPRVLKRFRHSSIEMQGNSYAEVYFGYQVGYGSTQFNQSSPVLYESGFQLAPSWDSFTWDSFTWDGRTLFPTEVGMNGTAENVQITISCAADYIYPFTVNSIINHYTPRRGMR